MVPERFQFKIGKTSKALVVTLFEPHERLIFVFQGSINQGEIKGRADEITVSAPCERVDLEALKATKARRKGAER
jgi:hypothetical protein